MTPDSTDDLGLCAGYSSSASEASVSGFSAGGLVSSAASSGVSAGGDASALGGSPVSLVSSALAPPVPTERRESVPSSRPESEVHQYTA